MIEGHIKIFLDVAEKLRSWIALREPNSLADKWVASAKCTPKMEKCKGKTADKVGHKWAGLVVSPVLCPEAFMPATMPRAKKKWSDFTSGAGSLPPGFNCASTGEDKGLVKYGHLAIHADYDLMYICKADEEGRITITSTNEEAVRFNHAKRLLNLAFKKEMIQHGTEFMYKPPVGMDPVGAAEVENIIRFGPPNPGPRIAVERSHMVFKKGRSI